MKRSSRSALAAVLFAALAGCGGGGGGGGSDGSPGGGGFAISPGALQFVFEQGGATVAPASQAVNATWTAGDAYYLGVAVAPGGSRPAWLVNPEVSPGARRGTITFSVAVTGLSPATYTANLRVGIARSDQSIIGYQDLTVTLVVHPAPQAFAAGTQLLVGAEGVALTSTPGASRLSRTLAVGTNRGGPAVPWTAASSQGWLHVTPAGAAGDALVLTADPASLTSDAVHEAVVTVASADPRLSVTTQAVRVGLWVGTLAPEPVTTVTAAYKDLAVDPVRPYAYLVDDTATIAIRNVHTGAAAGTIAVPGATLRSPTVTADGSRLYARDVAAHKVTVVDLAARTVVGSWPLPLPYERIVWSRVDGLPALLASSSEVFAPDTGAVLGRMPWINSSSAALAVSRDGTRLCALDLGVSPTTTRCAALRAGVGARGPAVMFGSVQSRWDKNVSGTDLALTADGSRLFEASGSLQLAAFDATGAALTTVPSAAATTTYLGAVAVGLDGRVYAGGHTSEGTATLFGWDGSGNLAWSRSVGAIMYGRLALSGDGLRAVALTGADANTAAALKLVTLP